MLAGERPFSGTTVEEIKPQVLGDASIPSIRQSQPDVPQRVEDIINGCLQKDRSLRYQTPRELVNALGQALSSNKAGPGDTKDLPRASAPATPPLPPKGKGSWLGNFGLPPRPPGWVYASIFSLAIIAVLIVVVAFLMVGGNGGTQPTPTSVVVSETLTWTPVNPNLSVNNTDIAISSVAITADPGMPETTILVNRLSDPPSPTTY